MNDQFTFKCSTCGEIHTGLPDLAFDSPHQYYAMSEDERGRSARLTTDTCVIANEDFFVRGVLEIPVHGRDEPFAYGVWVSLSRNNFERYQRLFDVQNRPNEPPYFGWFCNQLPGYPDTLNLKSNVHRQPYTLRPRVELEPTDHPLAREQRDGISIARLQAILEANRRQPPNKRLKLGAHVGVFDSSPVRCSLSAVR